MHIGVFAESLEGITKLIGRQLIILLGQRQITGGQVGIHAVRIVFDRTGEQLIQNDPRFFPKQEQRFAQSDQIFRANKP